MENIEQKLKELQEQDAFRLQEEKKHLDQEYAMHQATLERVAFILGYTEEQLLNLLLQASFLSVPWKEMLSTLNRFFVWKRTSDWNDVEKQFLFTESHTLHGMRVSLDENDHPRPKHTVTIEGIGQVLFYSPEAARRFYEASQHMHGFEKENDEQS